MPGECVQLMNAGQSIVPAVGLSHLWTFLEWVKTTDALSDCARGMRRTCRGYRKVEGVAHSLLA
jgi:hypothetical protein